MTLDGIRKYINFVINKDQLGEPQSPESYNMLLPVVSIEKYNMEYDIWLKTVKSDPLKRFIKKYTSNMSGGNLSLPVDYKYFISLLLEDDGVYKVVNMVSDIDNQRFNLLDHSPVELPIGAELPGNIEVYPATSGKTELRYFRLPGTPFYDYCMDANDNEVFMPVGSYIEPNANDSATLYDADGVYIIGPVSHPSYVWVEGQTEPDLPPERGPISPSRYTSKTVELDWSETDHLAVAEMIIAKVSRKNRELNDYQVATMEAAK